MKQRTITAILICIVVIPPLVFGGVLLKILLLAAATIAVYEIVSNINKKANILDYLALLLVVVVLTLCNESNYIAYLGLFVVGLFVAQIFNKEQDVSTISYLFILTVLFSLALRTFIYLYHTSLNVLIMIVVANYVCDTGAYLVGRSIGKRKLAPRISPNKTIEGTVGGFLASFTFTIIYGLIFLDYKLLLLVLLAIALGFGGQIGDLSFSSIKRKFGIKDFGTIFPGHGGILDRIDSLIFNLIIFSSVFTVIIRWFI